MISRVSIKNKGKQAKKVGLKNKDYKRRKTKGKRNSKERLRESNPAPLHVQATP